MMPHRISNCVSAFLCAGVSTLIASAAYAGPISVGAEVGLKNSDRFNFHVRFDRGVHHSLRLAYEGGVHGYGSLYTLLDHSASVSVARIANYYTDVTSYSVAYEYCRAGHGARSTSFLGVGPDLLRGRTTGSESESRTDFSGDVFESTTRFIRGGSSPFATVGLLAYAGYRAGMTSKLSMTAAIRQLWTPETLASVPGFQNSPRIDFAGLSAVFGVDWKF
jgi:hypothetical protein